MRVSSLSGEKKDKMNDISQELEDINNKLERIKNDTHNLNRIQTLSNSPLIIQELWKAVGRSDIRAAILHFTKDEISAGELADKVGIASENLSAAMKPFLGNKGYIADTKVGREHRFQRSELVDLVGFESQPKFLEMMKSWGEKRAKGIVPPEPVQENPNES